MKTITYPLMLCFCSLVSQGQTAEQKYETYVRENKCHSDNSIKCLKETSYVATRGDGRKVKISGVFEWVGENPNDHLFKPHFLMDYIRKLRNAYSSNSKYGDQLYNQIDFLVSKAVNRNGALVWENPEGIAQGLEQIEFSDFFITAANAFNQNNDSRTAKGIMTYALKFLKAVDMQAGIHTGGISSITTDCGAKKARARPCYWFHSRGLAIVEPTRPGARTVLNQHLHVVRDLLQAYQNINVIPDDLIAPEFGSRTEILDFIEDKAIGGLYQLAFSNGHKKVAPNRPPNIMQFMDYRWKGVRPTPEHPDGNPLSYYRAFYDFDMPTGKGLDIGAKCHYHTHVLNLIYGINYILTFDSTNSIFLKTKNGWRLFEATNALLEGKGEPTGMRGSTHAIYQFYRSEGPAYKQRRENCKEGEPLTADAVAWYRSLYDD